MSFDKNTAVTGFTFSLVDRDTATAITSGTVNAYYLLDGGSQTAIADTPVHEGNGQWSIDIAAGEINGDIVGFLFTHTNAIPVHFTIRTGAVFEKNVAITGFPFLLINKTTGTAVTSGTVTSYITIDGGTQTTLAGSETHEGNGQWSVDLAAGEMNGDVIGLEFTHADAIPMQFTIRTRPTSQTQSPVLTGYSRPSMAHYAQSAAGNLYIATGFEEMKRWDGFANSFVSAGVPAPSTNVTISTSGTGTITGDLYAYQRWLDADGRVSNLSPISAVATVSSSTGSITAATNASPISITSTAHGLSTGATVKISGVIGNYSANNTWTITKVDDDTFTLDNSDGSGEYRSGGTWYAGVGTVSYSSVDAPTDSRVARRQILRNKDGDVRTFYIDVNTTDLVQTSFSSTNTEAQIDANGAVRLIDTNGRDLNLNRHGEPPHWKNVVIHHYSRLWALVDVEYKEGAVSVTNGSDTVSGIGTSWTSVMEGSDFYPQGTNNTQSYTISSVDVNNQQLTLDENYVGTTAAFISYAIRRGSDARRTVYFSESGLPDSWYRSKALTFPDEERDGELVGAMSFDSHIYFLFENKIHRLITSDGPPDETAQQFSAHWRGCVNQRCWTISEGIAYLIDRAGIYSYAGNFNEIIGREIQPVFNQPDTAAWRINWQETRHFHASHDPNEDTVRFFVCLAGTRYPHHALAYNYRHKRWWIEEYPIPILSSALGVIDGREQVFYGTTGRRVLVANRGSLDGVNPDDGTVQGSVTTADDISITDSTATFHSSVVDNVVRIVSGKGKGQTRIIVAQTATKLTVKHPWKIKPSTSGADQSTYQIGGMLWRYRTGWFRYEDTGKEEQRELELIFKPVDDTTRMVARLYEDDWEDGKTTAIKSAATTASDYGGGFGTTEGEADLILDNNKTSGFARHGMDGFRQSRIEGSRHVQVELEGVPNTQTHEVRGVNIQGAQP